MVAVGKLFCFRCWSVRTQATCRRVVLKRPLGGTLLLEQWINFSPHETCSAVRFSPTCIWSDDRMCVCPRRSTVQMWKGREGRRERERAREEQMCCAVVGDLRSVWSDWGKWPLMLSLLELIQMTLGKSFWPGSHKDVLVCVCKRVCVHLHLFSCELKDWMCTCSCKACAHFLNSS